MPPRKKKAVKTPPKSKLSTPPSISSSADPTPTPSEPLLASESASSNAAITGNDHRLEPEVEAETEPKPSPQPEITTSAPAASKPASEEPPEAPGVKSAEAISAEPIAKPGTRTVIRVKKVIKKKIVKKLVPKGSVAAKQVDGTPQQDDVEMVQESSEKGHNPNSALDSSTQQVVMEKQSSPNAIQQPEPENMQKDNTEIKEDCLQVEAKDDSSKSKKVVRKKIVKKLVPKGSLAAKKVDAAPLQDTIVPLPETAEKDLTPNFAQPTSIQQDAAVKTSNSETNQQKEAEMVESERIEPVKSEDSMKMEMKDDNLQSGKEGDGLEATEVKDKEAAALSERMKRRKTEIFIGGLDRDANEEDIRSVFGKVGEILELRMMMDGQTGKNKGYAFLRYAEPKQAKRAVAEFTKVKVRGKICGAAALQGNDTIFIGSIDKKWKKEDLMKLLKEAGIENIDTLTVVMDPSNSEYNRGFAFLELETNRDAQRAFKKLQMKDILGTGRNIKVSWADSFNVPDEDDMEKVKSVYAEGVPDSWDEDKLKEIFKKFGEIERIVLGRNIKSAKRRDIAFINYKTRESALSCIESFSTNELTDNGSKVNLKLTLAKRVQKGNQNKGQKPTFNIPSKEPFKPSQGLPLQDFSPAAAGAKRNFSALGDGIYSDVRGYPRSRLGGSFGIAGSSYGLMPHAGVGTSYQHQPGPVGYSPGSSYRSGSLTDTHQLRQGIPPYTSSLYNRYQM